MPARGRFDSTRLRGSSGRDSVASRRAWSQGAQLHCIAACGSVSIAAVSPPQRVVHPIRPAQQTSAAVPFWCDRTRTWASKRIGRNDRTAWRQWAAAAGASCRDCRERRSPESIQLWGTTGTVCRVGGGRGQGRVTDPHETRRTDAARLLASLSNRTVEWSRSVGRTQPATAYPPGSEAAQLAKPHRKKLCLFEFRLI